MTTEWAVVAAAEQFTLDPRNSGELTFTVSNPGTAPDTVVFDVAPATAPSGRGSPSPSRSGWSPGRVRCRSWSSSPCPPAPRPGATT